MVPTDSRSHQSGHITPSGTLRHCPGLRPSSYLSCLAGLWDDTHRLTRIIHIATYAPRTGLPPGCPVVAEASSDDF